MGLILDSSVLISAERQGQNVRQMLSNLANLLHDTEIAISVITLIELAHGAARADTPHRKNKRTQFIQELLTALPVHPITASIALRAGQIDGKNQAKVLRLPLSDLLISAPRQAQSRPASAQGSGRTPLLPKLVVSQTPAR